MKINFSWTTFSPTYFSSPKKAARKATKVQEKKTTNFLTAQSLHGLFLLLLSNQVCLLLQQKNHRGCFQSLRQAGPSSVGIFRCFFDHVMAARVEGCSNVLPFFGSNALASSLVTSKFAIS